MSYFNKFPDLLYPFDFGNGKGQRYIRVKDIAQNVRIRKEILGNITLYDTYDIQDGETPEIISERLYGTPNYHWVIMLANERYDFYNDFPLSSNALEEFCRNRYGEDKVYDPHFIWGERHFEDLDGNIVDGPAADGVRAISNYEYEFRRNEAKRRIKVLNSNVIAKVVAEIETAFLEFQEPAE
jgi:hypothetical protein